MSDFKVYIDAEAVAWAAAEYIFQKIIGCIENNSICHVVLPGGSTPARSLELLAEKALPWEKIHWYPGDERCYPGGHVERNDSMIFDKLFSMSPESPLITSKPCLNFHRIPAELGPDLGAEKFAEILDQVGCMDIVILGIGEDGHTASLFPGNAALDDTRSAVPVYGAPKPPDERISIGLNMLKDSGECIVIATGENKNRVLKRIREGEVLPVSMVEPDIWFVDEAAAAGL